MTHEENFQRIENALRHSAEIEARLAERTGQNEREIEKNAAAIRDLIIVSRTLVDSHQKIVDSQQSLIDSQQAREQEWEQMKKESEESRKRGQEEFNANLNALIQAQMETEQKLQRWIDRYGN